MCPVHGRDEVLLQAGLPSSRMRVQIESAPEGAQKALLQELLDALKGGKALSAGLERRPDVFSHFYINMVRSGEASGHLADVLAELAATSNAPRPFELSRVSADLPRHSAAVATISVFIMLVTWCLSSRRCLRIWASHYRCSRRLL